MEGRFGRTPTVTVRMMPSDLLIDVLPDLVLELRRDGVVLAHGGGRDIGDLRPAEPVDGKPITELWAAPVAEVIGRLIRKALALRGATEAGLWEFGRRYQVRVNAQGPDRVVCVISAVRTEVGEGPEPTVGERAAQLDRREFAERFHDAVARATLCETPLAVAVIHVDGLSDIARLTDRAVAERIRSAAMLRILADAHRSTVQPDYFVGQLEEDELAIVLSSANRGAIEAIVTGTCDRLRQPIAVGDAEFWLVPHAGVAILSEGQTASRTLLEHARLACTEAQRSGDRGICFSSDALKLRSLERLDLASELRQAIEHRDIRLHYVGRHDLASGRLVACVGYLRWQHPARGEVRPAEFLALAEATGLATALSRVTLQGLAADYAALSDRWAPDVRISFGALHHHILHDAFATEILRFVDERSVPPERLELRVAERTFLTRDPAMFQSLARHGVRLVVDEVGRGMGSLDALARAPVWGLQLDRAWVTSLRADRVALRVCRAGIGMATALGIMPIASGVDDDQQREALLALGCRHGSGDLYHASAANLVAGDRRSRRA